MHTWTVLICQVSGHPDFLAFLVTGNIGLAVQSHIIGCNLE